MGRGSGRTDYAVQHWNYGEDVSDWSGMGCDHWAAAISARFDGEELGVEPRMLDAHLARCASCRAFEAALGGSAHAVHLGAADTVPDLSRPITRSAAAADRAGTSIITRVLLGGVSMVVLGLALRELLLGSDDHSHAHSARHLGAFSFAYGVGLLVVVLRPARARTMLPVAAVLAGALAITAVIDMANGAVPLAGEAIHLPELASVLLIWLIAAPGRRRAQRAERRSDRGLHAA